MGSSTIEGGEFLYDVAVNFTRVTEYGVTMQALLDAETPLPPAGARFDIAFEGSVRGPKLAGTVVGVDYLHARADRRIQLHIHAQITTDDGDNIAFFADGIAVPQDGTSAARLHESGTFMTASPRYLSLNQVQVWGQGTVDPVKGEVRIKAYAA
ncbi:MAG TPA: DUF3237 family protein [Candidatus Tectomicrobia bacterium]|nr:DUF3237 family protein [Candidatus Tectomicrobia bacterium]